jgi:hypothetical protein
MFNVWHDDILNVWGKCTKANCNKAKEQQRKIFEKQYIITYNGHRLCRNPSLGLMTKAKGLQGCGPRLNLGVAISCPGSAKECEGKKPHIPKWTPMLELESRWTPKCLESDCKGQNAMARGVLYIIRNLLKLRCLKWTCIIIWTSKTQVMAKRKVGSQIGNLTPNH